MMSYKGCPNFLEQVFACSGSFSLWSIFDFFTGWLGQGFMFRGHEEASWKGSGGDALYRVHSAEVSS